MKSADSATNRDPIALSLAEVNLDASFRREHPLAWWATLVGPFLLTLLILAILWEFKGTSFVWRLVTTAVATFLFFNKLVILGGTDGELENIRSFSTGASILRRLLGMSSGGTFVATVLGSVLG